MFDKEKHEDQTKTGLVRGKWERRPVGLSIQYHLYAYKSHQVMVHQSE